MQKENNEKSSSLLHSAIQAALLLVVVSLVVVFCDVNKSIPYYAKSSEARFNLGAIHKAQIEYRSQHNTYAFGDNIFDTLSWEAGELNLFYYYCGQDHMPNISGREVTYDPETNWPFSVWPVASAEYFRCIAIRNLDSDDYIDMWMIDEKGDLFHLLDDFRRKDRGGVLTANPDIEKARFYKYKFKLEGLLILSMFVIAILLAVYLVIHKYLTARKRKSDQS